MDRTRRLLEVGYLPSQLPPAFTTRDLAQAHSTFHAAWVALQDKPVPLKAPTSRLGIFSVARAGHQRRITSLPNPIAQTYLATTVATFWAQFVAHFRKSRLSASHPRFIRDRSRAACIPGMDLLYPEKIARSAGYRFMLRTDVSRFFPTIYTHSVPWAFHTKATAKKKTKDLTAKYFGNLIDLAIRQAQDGQTIGIPIGPDTSHIIAEAIATSVDLELKKRLKGWPAGFRYVDDYYLFFATAKETETALAALVRSLGEYELQLNFLKTVTCQVIEITDDYWTHQLRSFVVGKGRRRQASDLNHYFELAKDLARKNSDESVMTYALRRVSSIVVLKDSWPAFEAHLCHVALAFPNTLQVVARLMSTYEGIGYPLSKLRLERLVRAVIEDHAALGHHSEVAWSLWMCKNLGLQLPAECVDLVSDMHCSVCALILLDLHASGRLLKAPKLTYWKAFEAADALYSDMWLLSYEAGVRSWGGFTDAHVAADPRFDVLRAHNVRFYDETAKLSPLFRVKQSVLKLRQLASQDELFDLDDIDAFEDLVEYDDDEGGYESAVLGSKDADLDGDDKEESDQEDDADDEDDVYQA